MLRHIAPMFGVLVLLALAGLYLAFDMIRVSRPPMNALVYVDPVAPEYYLSPPCWEEHPQENPARFVVLTLAEARTRFDRVSFNPLCGEVESVSYGRNWLEGRGWVSSRWNTNGTWNW